VNPGVSDYERQQARPTDEVSEDVVPF